MFPHPSRIKERDFWIVQGAVCLITVAHMGGEALLPDVAYGSLHHLPVILYLVPIAYASVKYQWEGGVLTGGWVALLVLPSIVIWHREDWMWLGETTRVVLVIAVGVTLASRVEREARAQRRAEASEVSFQSLFEAAGDAILVYDQNGVIIGANASAAPFFGVAEPRQLHGQHVDALVPLWKLSLSQADSGTSTVSKGRTRAAIVRADGRSRTAEAVVSALHDSSGGEVFQAVLRDATLQEMREKGLRSLVQQISQAQEEERERIARELHDDSLQALVLLVRELDSIADIPGMPEEGKARLVRMTSLAASTGDALRRFSRDLRPSILNDLGLVPALEWLMEDLAKRNSLYAHFGAFGAKRRLGQQMELGLFRIAQEALRNVEKHAHASTVEMALTFETSHIILTISDNGLGFSPPSALEELVLTGKLGLVGLKERASLLGGNIRLDTTPGQGTRLSVEIPG